MSGFPGGIEGHRYQGNDLYKAGLLHRELKYVISNH